MSGPQTALSSALPCAQAAENPEQFYAFDFAEPADDSDDPDYGAGGGKKKAKKPAAKKGEGRWVGGGGSVGVGAR